MGYFNKSSFRSSAEVIIKNGPNSPDTSSIIYFFALSRLLVSKRTDKVKLSDQAIQRIFLDNVSEIIEINEKYTWNPLSSSKTSNWEKNKKTEQVVKSNLITRQYADLEPSYPRNRPVLDFTGGYARLHEKHKESLRLIFGGLNEDVRLGLGIILLRVQKFNSNATSLQDIKEKLNEIYGESPLLEGIISYDTVDTSGESPVILSEILKPELEPIKPILARTTVACTLSKPFLLLAGISGTGKSRFVRQQAALHDPERNNFCLVAVRPDWHEPSDLLGYVSRLSGEASYVATDVLRFVVRAWQALYDNDLNLTGSQDETLLQGDAETLNHTPPFWLCLDEMNLAPVEQYFADYLAVIETRSWVWNEEQFSYRCDALLKAAALSCLNESQQDALAKDLGLGDSSDPLWLHFVAYGIAIPPQLIVAGTVNMDETTHGFSRKVIDRALSWDFGAFFPNEVDDFYARSITHQALSFPIHSDAYAALNEADAQPSITFFKAINAVLQGSSFELAFRALNELLLAVVAHALQDPPGLQAVWDDFLMQKVLPRIEGDADKLQATEAEPSGLLQKLQTVLAEHLAQIWPETTLRPDFYRQQNGQAMKIACRSRQKIAWMQARLEGAGFTSFWP